VLILSVVFMLILSDREHLMQISALRTLSQAEIPHATAEICLFAVYEETLVEYPHAFITDLFSSKIVGWQVADHLRADLALDALEMAVSSCRGQIGEDLVPHSDRNIQYTSIRYTQRLEDIGAVRSVGSKGDFSDSAAAEAVNSLYEKELINREGPWQDVGEVTVATAEWVHWYNNEGLHILPVGMSRQ